MKLLFRDFLKRAFDVVVAFGGLLVFSWLIALAWLVACQQTRANGFFVQRRIGRYGKSFGVLKIRTMHVDRYGKRSSITVAGMNEITWSGRWMRRLKIDELPQLWNVLIGQMSFVGPRPDVPGYADKLEGENRKILALRPGITGPASIKYRNEEDILAQVPDPEKYNDEVIWPDKVKLNIAYYYEHSLMLDLKYLIATVSR